MKHVREVARRPFMAFADRQDAGRKLADYVEGKGAKVDAVCAVAPNGVSVGRVVALRFGVPMDVALVGKLTPPLQAAPCFGAVTLRACPVIDMLTASACRLDEERVGQMVDEAEAALRDLSQRLAPVRCPLDIKGRDVLLVDDGMGTGIPMKAVAGDLREQGVHSIAVAVPDASLDAIDRVESAVDGIYCLVAQDDAELHVGSYYAEWQDASHEQVIEMLRTTRGADEHPH
jgi:predicted phosphoribosyltransferase